MPSKVVFVDNSNSNSNNDGMTKSSKAVAANAAATNDIQKGTTSTQHQRGDNNGVKNNDSDDNATTAASATTASTEEITNPSTTMNNGTNNNNNKMRSSLRPVVVPERRTSVRRNLRERRTTNNSSKAFKKPSVAETYRDIYHAVTNNATVVEKSANGRGGLQQQKHPQQQSQAQTQTQTQQPETEGAAAQSTKRTTGRTTRMSLLGGGSNKRSNSSSSRSPAEQYREIYEAVGGGGGGVSSSSGAERQRGAKKTKKNGSKDKNNMQDTKIISKNNNNNKDNFKQTSSSSSSTEDGPTTTTTTTTTTMTGIKAAKTARNDNDEVQQLADSRSSGTATATTTTAATTGHQLLDTADANNAATDNATTDNHQQEQDHHHHQQQEHANNDEDDDDAVAVDDGEEENINNDNNNNNNNNDDDNTKNDEEEKQEDENLGGGGGGGVRGGDLNGGRVGGGEGTRRGSQRRKVKPPSWLSKGGYETKNFYVKGKKGQNSSNKNDEEGTATTTKRKRKLKRRPSSPVVEEGGEETDDDDDENDSDVGSEFESDGDNDQVDPLSSPSSYRQNENENENETTTTTTTTTRKKRKAKSFSSTRRNMKSAKVLSSLSSSAAAATGLTKEDERKLRAKERRKKPKFPSQKKINGLTPAMAIAIERTKAILHGPEVASSIPLPRVETTPLHVTTPPPPTTTTTTTATTKLPPTFSIHGKKTTTMKGKMSTTTRSSSLLSSSSSTGSIILTLNSKKKRPGLQPQSLERNKRLKEIKEMKQAKKDQELDEKMHQFEIELYNSDTFNKKNNYGRNKTSKLLKDGRAVTVIEARLSNDVRMVVPDQHNFTPNDVPAHPLLLKSSPSTPLRFMDSSITPSSSPLSKDNLLSSSSASFLLSPSSSPSSSLSREQVLSSSLEEQKLQWKQGNEEEGRSDHQKYKKTEQQTSNICQKRDPHASGTNPALSEFTVTETKEEMESTLDDPSTNNPEGKLAMSSSTSFAYVDKNYQNHLTTNESVNDGRTISITVTDVTDEGKAMSAAGTLSQDLTPPPPAFENNGFPSPQATRLDGLIYAVDQVNRASSALAMISFGNLSPNDFVDDDDVECEATQPTAKKMVKKRICSKPVTTKKVIKKKKVVKAVSVGAKKKKKKLLETANRSPSSSSLYKPVPAKHKDHISTLNLRAGQRVELFLNKVPRLGTLLEDTIDQYGWQKSRVKVRWDQPSKDKNEEMSNKHADTAEQKASKWWATSRPDGDGSFDWADTIALREPVRKLTTQLNKEIPSTVHTTAKKKVKIPAASTPIVTKKNEPASLFASRVSEPKTKFQDFGQPVVPTEQELRENSKPRARDALLNWYRRLEDLRQYRIKHGHTNVPQKYPENPPLGIWVNKMRFEKRALDKGEPSKITPFRIKLLEDAGFIWAKKKGQHAWEEQFQNMLAFKRLHGHVNVPTKSSEQRALGRWVSTQRSVYKRWKNGEFSVGPSGDGSTSSFAAENLAEIEQRIRRLDEIGFTWSLAPQGEDSRSGAEPSLSSDEN